MELGLRDPFRVCGTIHARYTARVPFGNAAWDTRIPGGGELGLRVGYAWGSRVTRGYVGWKSTHGAWDWRAAWTPRGNPPQVLI